MLLHFQCIEYYCAVGCWHARLHLLGRRSEALRVVSSILGQINTSPSLSQQFPPEISFPSHALIYVRASRMFLHEWALEMRPVCVTWQASSRHLTEKRQREKGALIALSLRRKIGAALYIRKKNL